MSLKEVKETFQYIKGFHRSKLYPYNPFRKVVDSAIIENLDMTTNKMYEVFEEIIESGENLSKSKVKNLYMKYIDIEGQVINLYLIEIKDEINFVLSASSKKSLALKDLNSEMQRFLYLYKQVMDWIIEEIITENERRIYA